MERCGGSFFAVRSLWTPQRALWILTALVLGMGVALHSCRNDFAQTRIHASLGPFF
jgi:hypothetical protein